MVFIRFCSYVSGYFNIKKFSDDYYKLTYIPHYNYKVDVYDGFSKSDNLKLGQVEADEFLQELEEEKKENKIKLTNNLSRAKGKVFDYAMCNKFDYFITLTLDKNKYDRDNLSKYIKDLGQFIRDQRKKFNTDIQYILIPEKHKNGSWHIHGLIRGIPESEISKNNNGYLDWFAYSNKFGYCSISKIRNHEAVAKYITKYISKSFNDFSGVTETNKKLYYNSRGLGTPTKIIEGQIEKTALEKISFDFENKYVSIKDLNKIEFLNLVGNMDF